MSDLTYKEPSKEFAFAYNSQDQDIKWASRVQDNTFANNSITEQTQQNKFLIPKEEFEKKLEAFKQNYLPKPYGGLEWHEFKTKYDIKITNKKGEKISVIEDEFYKQFKGVQLSYVTIKYPYIANLIHKDKFKQYDDFLGDKDFPKLLKTNIFNPITPREAITAYESVDKLDPAYVAVWFHNHPIEGEALLSNLPVELQRLPKVSLVRGFQEKQAEPAKEKKIDKTTGKEKEEINYDLKHTEKNNVVTLVNTIKKELSLNKEDTNMLSLLADIVMEAGLEDKIKYGLENVEGKDKFLNFLNKNEAEYKSPKPNEKIDESNLGKESNFLKDQKLTENLDDAIEKGTAIGIGTVGTLGGLTLAGVIGWPILAILAGVGLAGFGLYKLGIFPKLAKPLSPLARPFLRKRSLAKLQKRALGMPTMGGSMMGLELSEKMSNPKDETSKEEYKAWLMAQDLEQEKPENRNNRKFQENITKLENGDISVYFDRQLKEFKLAAMALPIAQTSTLFWDMSVRSKAGFFKHIYLKTTLGEDGKNSLLDLYVGDVLMENLRFIFPESTYGMGRLKAKNLHIQLRHQDLTNTTNLNSLIQGAIFMLMYRMMTDTGQIKTSADLLHKALGQNIHEGMTLDADAQYIGIENFYGTDFGKIGKIELGGDSPDDNTHISVTTTANPEFAQDQNIPNKKFLAEKKEELEELRNELQSKKSAKSDKKDLQKLEKKIQALEQEIATPEKEVLDSELKSQVNVSLTTNKLRFEEADMISSMVAEIAKAKLEEFGMKFENLKGLENFKVNGLKLGSNMSPQAITDLFFSSNEIIFDTLEADEFTYTLKDETKKDDKGKPLSTPTMSIKGCKTKMEGIKLDFYMKYPDYKVGEKFNEDDLPFDKLQIKNLHIPLTSIEDFHVVDEQSHVELTRLNGLSFIRDISIGTELDAKGLESFSLKVGKIDQQNKDQKNQTQNNFAFKTKDMDLNGKFTMNGISDIDYRLTTKEGKFVDLGGKEQSKRLMNHTFKLGGLSLGKSELSEFNMGKPSDSTYVSSKKGEVVSLESIDVKGFDVEMEEDFMSDKEQQDEHKAKKLEDKTYKEVYKYDPAKTKLVPKCIYLRELNIAKVKGGNLKVNVNSIDEKTKKVTPNFALDLGKDGFLENVKISNVQYDGKMGIDNDFLSHLTSGKLEMNAFKAPTIFLGLLGKLHQTETGSIVVTRFYNGTASNQRGAYFTIKDFKSKFDQPKNKKGDLLELSTGADLDGMIYDNGRFILKSNSRFTIPKLHWKSGTDEIISNAPAGIEGISVDIEPVTKDVYKINQFQLKETYVQNLTIVSKGFKMEFPKQYKTTIPNIWMQGLLNKKTLNYVGKGGLKNGFDWNEIKMSLHQDMYHFFRTNMALQAEKLDFERGADGSITFEMEGFKSSLNKNGANSNSLYWDGLSLNTPLDNSLVEDKNKPNQASLFNTNKITFKSTPDKDIDGNSIMRKTIIMENPTLNFLPLKGNIYAKNSFGKPSGLSAIELQDLLLNGKVNGNLVAKQIQTDEFKNKYWNKKGEIYLEEERSKEEAWEITAQDGGFEMNNLHAKVHNLDTLMKMFSSGEKPKEENKNNKLRNQDFAFLDNMSGSSVQLGFYGKTYNLNVERLDKNSQHINKEDRNATTDGAYIKVTDVWSEIRQMFFDNVKNKYFKKIGDYLSGKSKKIEDLADSLIRALLHKNGHILEYSIEKSFGKQVFLKGQGKDRNDLYLRLSAMAALSAGTLSIETKILEEFMKSEQLEKIRDKYEDNDDAREKAEKKLYDEIQSKMPSQHDEVEKQEDKKYQSPVKEKKPKKPTMQELVQKNDKNLNKVKNLDWTEWDDIKNTPGSVWDATSGYIDLLIELLWYTLFEEVAQLNPSLSLNLKYQNNTKNGGSLFGKDGLMNMDKFEAHLKIGQEVYKETQYLNYGVQKNFEFNNYIFKPLLSLENLSTNGFTIPIKTEQLIGNNLGKYDVTNQLIHLDSMQLKSLSLGTQKGWDYEDFRNGTIMEKLQNSPLDARGSGAKINGFRMLIRIPKQNPPKK